MCFPTAGSNSNNCTLRMNASTCSIMLNGPAIRIKTSFGCSPHSITLTFYLANLTRKNLFNCKDAIWWFWTTILMWLARVCSYLQGKREATGQHHGRQEDACYDFLMEVLHWECDAKASEIMSHYHHLHTIHGTTFSAISRYSCRVSNFLLRSFEHKLHRGMRNQSHFANLGVNSC